jgi:hypothetical protein
MLSCGLAQKRKRRCGILRVSVPTDASGAVISFVYSSGSNAGLSQKSGDKKINAVKRGNQMLPKIVRKARGKYADYLA